MMFSKCIGILALFFSALRLALLTSFASSFSAL